MNHSDIRWIVQRNLIGRDTLEQLTEAIKRNQSHLELIDVVPFDLEVRYSPPDDKFPIIYGSSAFMYGSLNHECLKQGVFFNPETFRMSTYLEHWSVNVLNHDGLIIEVGNLARLDFPREKQVFVRPDDDSKSFAGMICDYEELLQRFGCLDGSNPYLRSDSLLLLAPPKVIEREWRCFIVKGKVIAASRYRVLGENDINPDDLPDGMVSFAEEMCRVFTPHDVFVMDVAQYNSRFKVIECNCFNGSGTYNHDWVTIVRCVQEYVVDKQNTQQHL